ncbi:MAG TPA: hypothetical protein VK465_08680 [Fibrobacteria bacterium]|nr:hypothetical protein [Fibrobacteria bacterium]
MKKLVLVILGLLSIQIFGESYKTQGQGAVAQNLVTWTSGTNTGKTRILLLGNNVYLDTAAAGSLGQWKRIDNTADSCSLPVLLGSDSAGSALPIWMSPLAWAVTYSNDPANSAFVYRMQARLRRYDGSTKKTYWTAWTRNGTNGAYVDVALQDSLLFPAAAGVTARTKVSQYAMGNIFGHQVRLCPDDTPTTGDDAADSVIVDSTYVITR